MLQLGRNQREWERENLENECGSQKSVREVRESKIARKGSVWDVCSGFLGGIGELSKL